MTADVREFVSKEKAKKENIRKTKISNAMRARMALLGLISLIEGGKAPSFFLALEEMQDEKVRIVQYFDISSGDFLNALEVIICDLKEMRLEEVYDE